MTANENYILVSHVLFKDKINKISSVAKVFPLIQNEL